MRRLILILFLSLGFASSVHGHSLALTVNSDMAEFAYATEVWAAQNAELGVGVLFNDDDDWLGSLRLVSNNRVSNALRFAVGMQGYLGKLDKPDTSMRALAIGGSVGFGLASQIPLSLVLEGWYAPKILSFGKIDDAKELAARIQADLSQHAAVYVGYRKLKADLKGDRKNHKLDSGLHLGLRINF